MSPDCSSTISPQTSTETLKTKRHSNILLTQHLHRTPSYSDMSTIPANPPYNHHSTYSEYGYPGKNTLPSPRIMTNSYSHNFLPSKQPSHSAPMPVSQSTPALSTRNRSGSQRKPDWHEFYKNGVPKEVILIDDDTPPPRQQPSRQGRRGQEMGGAPLPQPSVGKKRKLDQSYGQEYHDSPAFSTHPAHFGDTASVSSHSGTRTTSHQTTAPTSLESYGSNAASNSYEDVNVGQKRKRVQPQKETRAQVKRKQQEATSDAFHDYVPPPVPVRKAPEVHVPVVRDVSENPAARGRGSRAYTKKTLVHKTTKVDDDDGHYIINPGSALTERYDIQRLLGQGTFGKVVEAYDKKKKTKCAVKIIRSVQKYRDASRIELRVLSTLALNDRTNKNKCIHLRDSFDFRNHICIVTDLLGQSVFDFLKGNGFVPFPSTQIQSFARQLFTSVAFLHDLNLIHTDLKPENILLVNGLYQTFTYNRNIPSSSLTTSRTARQRRVLLDSEIRLIDFGSATFDDEYHSSVVSTRHYRAPEIILQLGWSFPCDIWSIGCIIVEFFTGDALFQTHDNLEHLAMMENVCNGKIPPKLVKQVTSTGRGSNGNQAAKFFQRGKLCYPNQETSRASRKYVKAMKHLNEFIPTNTTFNRQMLDLLKRIFVYDPKERITAKEALKHPWFRETLVDDGTEAIRIRNQKEEEFRAAKRPREM